MTAAQVLRTLRAVPFRPFSMYLVDGRSIEVRHPELIRLAGGGRIALAEVADGTEEAIDVLMIVSLRPAK